MKRINFHTLVEQVLTEMPHLEVSAEGDMFDLEVERFANNKKGFVSFLRSILSGKRHTDKYGNVIELRNKEDKKNFLEKVKSNDFIRKFLKK